MKFSLAVAFAALCGATTLEFSPMPIAVASSLVEASASPQAQSKAMQEARASVFSNALQVNVSPPASADNFLRVYLV